MTDRRYFYHDTGPPRHRVGDLWTPALSPLHRRLGWRLRYAVIMGTRNTIVARLDPAALRRLVYARAVT